MSVVLLASPARLVAARPTARQPKKKNGMRYVSWRALTIGLSIGAFAGLTIGLAARNSFALVAVLFLTIVTILVAIAMMFFGRSRPLGAIFLLAACVMLVTSWGVMALRGL